LNQELTSGQIASLVIGETYEITFQARTNAASRPLRMYFGEDGGGFAAISVQDYTINNTMATYQATFVVNNTYGAMKLGFEMGTSNDEVYIDNVVLQPSSSVAPPPQPTGLVANTPTESSVFVAVGIAIGKKFDADTRDPEPVTKSFEVASILVKVPSKFSLIKPEVAVALLI
jgi:hypothetical protein